MNFTKMNFTKETLYVDRGSARAWTLSEEPYTDAKVFAEREAGKWRARIPSDVW